MGCLVVFFTLLGGVPLYLIGIGLGLMAFGHHEQSGYLAIPGGKTATGTVVSTQGAGKVRYTDSSGRVHTFKPEGLSIGDSESPPHVGDMAEVSYDPRDPAHARVVNTTVARTQQGWLLFAYVLIGVGALLVPVWVYSFARGLAGRRSRRRASAA